VHSTLLGTTGYSCHFLRLVRSGLAGTVLVYKIAGALANRGGSVDEVYSLATWIAGRLGTIGVSLGHTSVSYLWCFAISKSTQLTSDDFRQVPGTKANRISASPSEIEIGMGIHNEAGHTRLSPAPKLSELVPRIIALLTSTTDPDRSFVPFRGRDNVVLLINNLGGVSELELGAIVSEVKRELDNREFNITRMLVGTYMVILLSLF